MQSSTPPIPAAASTGAAVIPRPRPLRSLLSYLFKTLPGRLLLVIFTAALLFTGNIWYTHFHGTGWSQTLNPMLWYRRSRGEDLYFINEGLLVHGNRALHEVALTFDDGPHPQSRAVILDTLRRYGVHATFFDVGLNMSRRPDLVRRTLQEGDEVGNHTYNHFRLDDLTENERHREINDPDITFCAISDQHLRLLRPPGMRYNRAVLDATKRLGYIVVSYTTASQDFDPNEPADVIADRTLRRTENGSIILLHDYPATAKALPRILENLKTRGYRCVTISEMLAHLPEPVRDEAAKRMR